MAMCTSGSLSICATAGTNRSIATAVINSSSGSLSSLSVSAGKSAPHCMREFYGYSAGIIMCVSLGTVVPVVDNVDCYVGYRPIVRTGQCADTTVTLCFDYDRCLAGDGLVAIDTKCNAGSWVLRFYCNNPGGSTGSFTIPNIDYNDTVCVRTEMGLDVPYEDYAQTTIGFHSPAGSVQAGSVNTIVACAPTSWTCCLGE